MCSIENSAFQFTKPTLSAFDFEINEKFKGYPNQKIEFQTKISVTVQKNNYMPNAFVTIDFELGEKNDKCPFYIHAIEKAHFQWENNLDEETVKNLLNRNAPALLLSYLRPIVAQITSASMYGTYNIPFMNFTAN